MPAFDLETTQNKSNDTTEFSDKLLTAIVNEKCNETCLDAITTEIFKKFLDHILLNTECNKKTSIFNLPCDNSDEKNSLIHAYLEANLENNRLCAILKFLGDSIQVKKNTLPDDVIKDLIFFIAHFNTFYEHKINNTQRVFNTTDLLTFSSFLYFFSQLLTLPTVNQFDTPQLISVQNNTNFFQTITFAGQKPIEFFIGQSNQLLQNFILHLKSQQVISDNAMLFLVKQIGKFGFIINRNFPSLSGITDKSIHEILTHQLIRNISRESIVWTYLDDYHQHDSQAIKEGCNQFDLQHCHPVKTQLFQAIISGKNLSEPSLSDFKTVENEIFWTIHCDLFTPDKNTHVIEFLKNFLITNKNAIGDTHLTRLLNFVSYHIHALKKNETIIKNFPIIAENLSFLLFNIIKHTQEIHLHDQIYVMNEFVDLYKSILMQTPPLTTLSNTLVNHLFNMLARSIDSKNAVKIATTDFITIIQTVTSACKENLNASDLAIVAALSFKSLGHLYRKNSNTVSENINITLKITREAMLLIKSLRADLNQQQLNDAVSFFFKPQIKQRILNQQCKQLFGLTGCRPARFINLAFQTENTMEIEMENELLTTLTSENPINPTTETSIPLKNNTSSQNSTALTELPQKKDTAVIMPSLVEFSASAAHGVLSGTLNGIIQYFSAKQAYRGERRLTQNILLLYSSMFAQATLAATFPFMLNEIQKQLNQKNEAEAEQLSTLLLEESLPIFMSSLGVNLGLQLIHEFTHLFTNPWVRLLGGNILPFMGTAVSAIKNPLSTVTQIGTSITTSSLIYGLFNRIAPVKQHNPKDSDREETNAFEMKPLNTEKAMLSVNGNLITAKETLEKTLHYIDKNNFEQIKNKSQHILNKLEKIADALEESIEKMRSKIEPDTMPPVADTYQRILDDQSKVLQLIQQEQEACRKEVSFLQDDHRDAYQKYTISANQTAEEKKEIEVNYISAMEKLGNVFKRMEPMFNNMKSNLGKAEGYITGAHGSFSGNDQTQEDLKEVIEAIPFPLSLVKLYLNTYSTSQAAEKAEKRGFIKALSHQQFFEKLSSENNLNPRRPKKTRAYSDNRCQSMTSDSKTLSSASEESSVLSIGSSKDNEEVQIVRPLLNS